MKFRRQRTVYNTLNEMLDMAISGEFKESDFDESEMSKLEVKWKRFLEASVFSHQNIEKERTQMKELVSDISHQVKTPIANIKLYGELIREKIPQEDYELTDRLASQTELLESLIQSLVKMSRLETNVIQVSPVPQPIRPMLDDIIERGRKKQEERKIQLVLNEESRECTACFDAKWTTEAVYNILDNALKYTEQGSTVNVLVKEYPMFACIQIQDEGPGILEEEVPKIFQRFYRSQTVREQEGVGLGLYLARTILKKEQGYIKVMPRSKKGTTFAIYLPKENLQNC